MKNPSGSLHLRRKLSSSSGLGRGPLKAKTGVRLPVGAYTPRQTLGVFFQIVNRNKIAACATVELDMLNIEHIVRRINKDLVPQFEEKLRVYLADHDKEWLIEQIVRLTLDAHSLQAMDRKIKQEIIAKNRVERFERVKALGLDRDKLSEFIKKYGSYTRGSLIKDGYLLATAPEKGTDLISPDFRTAKGNQLLVHAKDVLFALLFGDTSTLTSFDRHQQELLTLTLPRFKAESLDFMKATTELSALGTWQDPDSVSNDQRADNVIFEVEYGEIEGELIGDGVVHCLSLINNLEVNEQILYARMINLEQSTLIE